MEILKSGFWRYPIMISLLLAIIYLAFIGLGLPDSLLGSAWPTIRLEMGIPVSYAGIVSMIIAIGTIISSLLSSRVIQKFGPGLVTAVSVGLTAVALFGFSISNTFILLCLWAVPYGLGAGAVDAALNNYVAVHYSSRHMSWLHAFWGLGVTVSPYIMSACLTGGLGWQVGYQRVSIVQIILTAILFAALPLWKRSENSKDVKGAENIPLSKAVKIRGVPFVLIAFFCYCAIEQTAGLWASSYLVLHCGLSQDTAASFASLFFVGITIGRALGGFLTLKLDDVKMIRLGQIIVAAGALLLLFPLGNGGALAGLILVGLGCAPIYPSVIHSTPERFGADQSQAIIGVQMASAYVGTCLMPPIFGMIANHISVSLLPLYLLLILAIMVFMHEKLLKATANRRERNVTH